MGLPTLQGATVNSVASALSIFYAVYLGILEKAEKRLDVDERESLKSGDVYVWEERDFQSEGSEGIERWTDGIKWGSSREFLFYYERDQDTNEPQSVQDTRLIKQTYSVFLQVPGDPRNRTRKWHMVAYYSQSTVERLRKVEDIPQLASLQIPDAFFRPARVKRGQARRRGSSANSRSPPPPNTQIRRSLSATERPSRRLKSHSPPRLRTNSTGDQGKSRHATPYDRVWRNSPSLAANIPQPYPGSSRRRECPAVDQHAEYEICQSPLPRLSELGKSNEMAQYFPASSSPLPSIGYHDSFRILPLPNIPRSPGLGRSSTDYKALDALQKQFMK